MASKGFEFVGMLDGPGTPTCKNFVLGAAAAHKVGDLVLMQADGFVDQVVGSIDEITGVMAEAVAAADITAGTTTAKVYIVTRQQIWRCSTDASSTSAVVGFTKTWDTVDCNTIDADDITNGSMIAYKITDQDAEGNNYDNVISSDTTLGNA